MSDRVVDGHDFDELVGQEWDTFQVALGDHLASLHSPVRFEVHSYGHEEALMVITRTAHSGAYDLTMPVTCGMDFDVAQRLGLSELDPELDVETATWQFNGVPSPDQVAWTAVTLCRGLYAVASPAVLEAGGLTTPAPDEPEPAGPELDLRQPITVESREELADAIEQTVDAWMPDAFTRDEFVFTSDGDPGQVLIRPDGVRCAIWVVMWPVAVRPTATAVREVQILNRDAHFGRYYLKDGMLLAEATLLADPFVPNHLIDTTAGLIDEVKGLADDFAWRTHGKVLCTE